MFPLSRAQYSTYQYRHESIVGSYRSSEFFSEIKIYFLRTFIYTKVKMPYTRSESRKLRSVKCAVKCAASAPTSFVFTLANNSHILNNFFGVVANRRKNIPCNPGRSVFSAAAIKCHQERRC